MSKNKVGSFVNFIILMAIIMLVTWGAGLYPALAYMLPFVVAICFAIMMIRSESIYSVVGAFAASFFSFFLTKDILGSIFSVMVISVAGILVGHFIKNKKSVISMLITAGAGFLVSNAGYLLLVNAISGANPLTELNKLLQPSMLPALEEALIEMGLQDYASMASQIYGQVADMMLMVYPAITILASAVMGYVLLLLIYVILKIMKSEYKFDLRFSGFRADGITVFIFFIAVVATFFISEGILATVFYNIYMIIMFVLQICGLSLLDYLMKNKWKWPLFARLLAVAFLCVISSLSLVSTVLIIAAIIDSRRDFRGLVAKNDNKSDGE